MMTRTSHGPFLEMLSHLQSSKVNLFSDTPSINSIFMLLSIYCLNVIVDDWNKSDCSWGAPWCSFHQLVKRNLLMNQIRSPMVGCIIIDRFNSFNNIYHLLLAPIKEQYFEGIILLTTKRNFFLTSDFMWLKCFIINYEPKGQYYTYLLWKLQ